MPQCLLLPADGPRNARRKSTLRDTGSEKSHGRSRSDPGPGRKGLQRPGDLLKGKRERQGEGYHEVVFDQTSYPGQLYITWIMGVCVMAQVLHLGTRSTDLEVTGDRRFDGPSEGTYGLEHLRGGCIHRIRQDIFVGCFEQVQLIPMCFK